MAALLRRALNARAVFVCLIVAASLKLLLDTVLTSPLDRAGDLRQILVATGLLSAIALISRWFPASGPRFGDRVSLLPLAALAGMLLVPPGFALIPVLAAGVAAWILNADSDSRSSQIDRSLLLVAAQLSASAILSSSLLHQVIKSAIDGRIALLCFDLASAALFGVIYLGGVYVLTARGSRSIGRKHARHRAWRVYCFNEAVVYWVGAPFLLASVEVWKHFGSLVGAGFLLLSATALLLVTHSLVDGKMVRRQLHAMDRLTQQAAIGRSPSSERFMADFLEHCNRIILYDKAYVWLQNEEELILEKVLEYSGRSIAFQPELRRSGEDLVGRVAERSKTILVDDARRDPRHRYYALSEDDKQAIGRVSAMLIPLLAAGELVGVVEFERFGTSPYTGHDRERVQSQAGLVAMTLANNRLHQDVVQQAVTDGLTGLYNKRQILKTLADEAARAQRYGHPLSVMMLDLDEFKRFNDTYGHMQGDVLLQCLSGLIKHSIRNTDTGGRYGGEEFIVVMPETGREAAWVTAERIRSRVEDEAFVATVNYEAAIGLQEPTADRAPRQVTVHKTISIGIASLPGDAIDHEDLLARADEALYTAKNAGRNRVVLAANLTQAAPRIVTAEAAARRN